MNQQPHPRTAGRGTKLLLLLVALAAMVLFGFNLAGFVDDRNQQILQSQARTISLLESENQSLITKVHQAEARVEMLRVEADVMIAQQQVLAEELEEANNQIAFYQRVVAPEVTQDGFLIDGVEVQHAASNGYFRLRFVLLQQRQNKAVIKGQLSVSFSGSKDGEPYTVETGSADLLPEGPIGYRFKFFQSVTREFRLPGGFTPEYIHFSTAVYQYTTFRGNYQRKVAWQDAVSGLNAGTGD